MLKSLPDTLNRVHDPESGRIDARQVADLYQIRLKQLAAIVGQPYETLRKRPGRDEAQGRLSELVRVFDRLTVMLPAGEVASWLQHPLPRRRERPLDILLADDGLRVFTEFVDSLDAGGYA